MWVMQPRTGSLGDASSRPGPMYLAIAGALASEIKAGRYSRDELLPTEAELQKRFGVSRHTVREAIRELQEQGFVYTQQGVGTRVRAPQAAFHFVHGSESVEDLLQFSRATSMRVTGSREVRTDQALAARLRTEPGERWLELDVLRFANDDAVPIGGLNIYLRPEFSGVVGEIGEASRPIFSLVEDRYGVQLAEMEQEIASVSLDSRTASWLAAPVGTHALELVRRFIDVSGRLTQVSIGVYPGGRFAHRTKVEIHRGPGVSLRGR